MTNNAEIRYIQAYARIIGVKENDAIEYAQRKGLTSLVDNADQLLTTQAQRDNHQAFLDLYRMSSSIESRNPVIRNPETASAYFHSIMEKVHDREMFAVAFLNTRNRVIDYDIVSVGTVNSSIVHPREVFRKAVVNKASAVIFCHNHPSGIISPSQEDIDTTNRLKDAGRLLGISVMDHVIITGIDKDNSYSFKQNSILEASEPYSAEPVVSQQEIPYKTTKEKMKEITDKLEKGIRDVFASDRYKAYLQTMSRFHQYSFNNTLLIALQRPDATLVTSFNKWRDQFNRNVKKGEKGIRIIAPSPYKVKKCVEKIDPVSNKPLRNADGEIITEEREINVPMYRIVSIFDISQTEGAPLPEIAGTLTGDISKYDLLFKALRRSSPVPIDFAGMRDNVDGLFNQEKQTITIRSGMSEIQTVSAVIHEIAHAKLHNKQLMSEQDQNQNPANKPLDRRTKEVEAESVSFAVCTHFGIETGENSFGYIAAWSKDKDLPELKASLERISSTSADLIDEISNQMETVEKEQRAVLQKSAEISQIDEIPNEDKLGYGALLDANTADGAYQIYQLKAEPELKFHRFASIKKLEQMGHSINPDNYACIYHGDTKPADQAIDNLNTIYEKFNLDRPADYTGYSLSISDVIVLKTLGQVKAYFVDDFGFKELPDFLEQLHEVHSQKDKSEHIVFNHPHDESASRSVSASNILSVKLQLQDTYQAKRTVSQQIMKKCSSPER